MKLLAFERRYVLESTPCESCRGSGKYNMAEDCWNCRGLGRRISLDGRELFYAVAELLNVPVIERESRIPPKHLDRLFARQVTAGMKVGRAHPDHRTAPQLVTAAVPIHAGNVEIKFESGGLVRVSDHELFNRELTEKELEEVDQFMAEYLGDGAVLAAES